MTDVDDVLFRSALAGALLRPDDQPSDLEVDAAWHALVRTVRDQRRRRITRLVVTAAAVLLVLALVGPSTVVNGGAALARFLTDAADRGVGAALTSRLDDAVGPPSGAHGPIDESNRFWVEVRAVHGQLNDAVGWDRWRPEKLDGAADRLRTVADQDPELAGDARQAADLIDAASAARRRDDAVRAHRVVEQIELRLRLRSSTTTTSR